MRAFRDLTVKHLLDALWPLGLSALALFALGWLGVYRTCRLELQIREALERGDLARLGRFARGFGGMTLDYSSASIEMNGWNLPFILLPVIVWAIGRGSIAVAGELERGTMDLILSRPVPRASYLLAQVATAAIGLAVLSSAIVAGHAVGVRYNTLQAPPSWEKVALPAINLASLGLVIFAATLLASSVDRARWRPNLIGSCLTLASYVVLIVVNQPGMEDFKHLERFSVFKAYNPAEVATVGATFGPNVATLLGLAIGSVALAMVAFGRRDLPAGS